MKSKSLIRISLVTLLVILHTECLCFPIKRINQFSAAELPNHKDMASRRPDSSKHPSDCVVVYIPYVRNRIFGIGPFNLRQALQIFLKSGGSHPYGPGSYAAVVLMQSQKDTLLGLLDTKKLPVHPSDNESEILLTEQSWNKMIIIDQYGVTTEFTEQHGILIEKSSPNKLTPLAFQKIKNLLGQVFPQSLNDTLTSSYGGKT